MNQFFKPSCSCFPLCGRPAHCSVLIFQAFFSLVISWRANLQSYIVLTHAGEATFQAQRTFSMILFVYFPVYFSVFPNLKKSGKGHCFLFFSWWYGRKKSRFPSNTGLLGVTIILMNSWCCLYGFLRFWVEFEVYRLMFGCLYTRSPSDCGDTAVCVCPFGPL